MKVIFIHGMGRSPISGWPMLRKLRRAGFKTSTFGYVVALEAFETIKRKLVARIVAEGKDGDYVLVGHSLGGVLIRAALPALPDDARMPRHVFLLGSPVVSPRHAQRLSRNPLFRVTTGDCGQLLASAGRMAAIGEIGVPVTAIVGTRGVRWPFGEEPNDGIVSLSEVSAPWLTDQVRIPVIHTLLPAHGDVADIICARLRAE